MSERRHGIFRVEIVADGTGRIGEPPSGIFGEDGTDPFPEVARILRALADTLAEQRGLGRISARVEGKLTDSEGRPVGSWELT